MSDTCVHDLTIRYGYEPRVNTSRRTVLVGRRWVYRGLSTLAEHVTSHVRRRLVFKRARRA